MIKVHNGQEIFRLQPSFYKLVGEGACSFQAASGKETGSSQDHLVCFHLLTILTSQSHISKVIVFSQVSKCTFDIFLEVIPLEAELLRHVEASRSLGKLLR